MLFFKEEDIPGKHRDFISEKASAGSGDKDKAGSAAASLAETVISSKLGGKAVSIIYLAYLYRKDIPSLSVEDAVRMAANLLDPDHLLTMDRIYSWGVCWAEDE